ncbi:BglG family transcription antiterminator [Ligilactobacillus salitolerans]|uniref:BglG family transcription antiterminator n=1 Tax=Ligilactobacillus salitolerans TaxID=1808352 RepID=UPI001E64A9C2|nr:PTS sugar transporter subunit IIA [Ligilactobacillus salitolerans]
MLTIAQIADFLNVSARTAYLTINGVNDWLAAHDLAEIQNVRDCGYHLAPENYDQVSQLLESEVRQANVDLPRTERVMLIEFAVLCQAEPISLQFLRSLTGVTTRTVQSDLAEVRKKLVSAKLKLLSVKQHFAVQGQEEELRKYTLRLLNEIQDTIVQDKIATLMPFDEKQRAKVERGLLHLEQQTGHYLTDDSLFQVKQFIYFSLVRYRNHCYLTAKADDVNAQRYHVAELLAELGVSQEHLAEESSLLAKVIRSRQASYPLKIQGSNELYLLAGRIIKNFVAISGVKLANSSLQKQLYTHLIAAKHRVKYQIQFQNSETIKVQKKYPELYLMTKQSVKVFEEYLGAKLTTAEIELIALYFGGELEKVNFVEQRAAKHRVLLVCGSGMGTSRFLQIRLEKLFPKQLEIQIVTKQSYEQADQIEAELVITTLPLTEKNLPVINIKADLTESDIQEIQKYLPSLANSEVKHASPYVKATQVLDIVSEYARVENFPGLTAALQSYFLDGPENQAKAERQLGLSDLLPTNRIVFKQGKYSWQEAVQLSGELLEKDQVTEAKYTRLMQKQIENYGPYMAIMPDVMLLHAKPEISPQYKQPGMGLIYFQQPVSFNAQTKARYIFSLYSPTMDLHVNALTQLTEILSNNKLVGQFKDAQTPEELTRLFIQATHRGEEK